jgi:RHS repeat-associated protein
MAVTDASGTLISQQRYLPFGGVRDDAGTISQTDYGYTSQRNLDSGIGLMDYKARFYSPYLNRFIQPDTILPNLDNPQYLNRYSYVINQPIVLNDPSGHCPTCIIGLAAGAIAGAVIYASTTWAHGREWNNNDYLASVALGALGGGLIGTGFAFAPGLAAFTAIGAGSGAISSQFGYAVGAGKDYSSEELVIAALWGLVG